MQDLEKLISQDAYLNSPLIESLCRNIDQSLHLNFLQLCSLKLTLDSWKLIADSLKENKTITILSLNAMSLNPTSLEVLVPAFSNNRTIETLDLSYNYMGDKVASFLTKLISN